MHSRYCIKKSAVKNEELYLLQTHGMLHFGTLAESFDGDTHLVVKHHPAEARTFIKEHSNECGPANVVCRMEFKPDGIWVVPTK